MSHQRTSAGLEAPLLAPNCAQPLPLQSNGWPDKLHSQWRRGGAMPAVYLPTLQQEGGEIHWLDIPGDRHGCAERLTICG